MQTGFPSQQRRGYPWAPGATILFLADAVPRTGDSGDGAGRRQSVTAEDGHLGSLQPGDDPDFRVAAEGLKGGVT